MADKLKPHSLSGWLRIVDPGKEWIDYKTIEAEFPRNASGRQETRK
jgi:hypothetical protein